MVVRARKLHKNKAVAAFIVTAINLDTVETANTILMQGQIDKRGQRDDSEFISMWVVVTPSYVSYAKFENAQVIDRIEINEVVGIASRADDREEHQVGDELNTSCVAATSEGLQRNSVFWRFKLDLREAKKKAFTYKLGRASFALFTSPYGFHRGRTFVFRFEDNEVNLQAHYSLLKL